jgi:hypothetical protein
MIRELIEIDLSKLEIRGGVSEIRRLQLSLGMAAKSKFFLRVNLAG